MLISLRIESKYRWPIDGSTGTAPRMTVFVERIAHSQHARGEIVARMDIVHDGTQVSAGVIIPARARIDVEPINVRVGDGVWEIVSELIRAMYPAFA
ncbi:hypothetical protein JG536_28130 (plasmid) [Burkholderia ambifaria]|uniref:hypothetical protein n=1 Tax=Burkholderia ambifaria TaxID=152480 RepID=UPI00158B06A9|nr:hypothetical protein [Burkholderia ambifaria]QQJ96418.1 hypothetical protein JG536_12425 [Burkholderia ambifaria]QQK01067.1 hypothetical protein JG536_28130 [Burkholderia ambifaria]